jgi:hypothetical protein
MGEDTSVNVVESLCCEVRGNSSGVPGMEYNFFCGRTGPKIINGPAVVLFGPSGFEAVDHTIGDLRQGTAKSNDIAWTV